MSMIEDRIQEGGGLVAVVIAGNKATAALENEGFWVSVFGVLLWVVIGAVTYWWWRK